MSAGITRLKYGQERYKELAAIFKTDQLETLDLAKVAINKNLDPYEHFVLFSEIERSITRPWAFSYQDEHALIKEIGLLYLCAYYIFSLEDTEHKSAQTILEEQKEELLYRADTYFRFQKGNKLRKLQINKMLDYIHDCQKHLPQIQLELKEYKNELSAVRSKIVVRVNYQYPLSFNYIESSLPYYNPSIDIILMLPAISARLLSHLILLAEENLYMYLSTGAEFSAYPTYNNILISYCIIAYLTLNQKQWANSKLARELTFSHFEYLLINRCITSEIPVSDEYIDFNPLLRKGLDEIKHDLEFRMYFDKDKHLIEALKKQDNSIADRLKRYMNSLPPDESGKKRKITQKQLASLLGTTQGNVSKILKRAGSHESHDEVGSENTRSVELSTLLEFVRNTGLGDEYMLGLSDDITKRSDGLRPLITKYPKKERITPPAEPSE